MAASNEGTAAPAAKTAYVAGTDGVIPSPVGLPVKAKRGRRPASPVIDMSAPIEEPAVLEPIVEVEAEATPVESAPADVIATPGPARIAKAKAKTAKSPVPAGSQPLSTLPIAQIKETSMENPSTFADSAKDAATGAQTKAKELFAKSAAAVGEIGDFAKGNVEALVESGKILASGIQEIGSQYVADTKSAIETLTTDVKDLSAVRSPTDFFKLHTSILRRNFDGAMAYGSKNGEAMMKLANSAFAPISGRVSLAVEKVRKVA